MGNYCTIQDVWEQIKMDQGVMSDAEVEKRITQAEKWVNTKQNTTYSGTIPDSIKYATASYAASLVLDFVFTMDEPNQSNHAARLVKAAKDWLDSYNEDTSDPESEIEKINSDFFDPNTG